MHIIFGQELEGCPLPVALHGINQLIVGPGGFLDFLELRLGLPPGEADETARLLSYREALQLAGKEESRFFDSSFEVDPLGSAKMLLKWRDELVLNGWKGEVSPAFRRIGDLSAVETIFQRSREAETGEANRLRAVTRALADGGDPKIGEIKMIETLDHFPVLWRDVLSRLPIVQEAFVAPRTPLAKPGTRLHVMQCRLLEQTTEVDPDSVQDDSIRIVESPVLSKNASAAANWLHRLCGNAPTRLIADPLQCGPLDEALFQLDAPLSGSATRSSLGTLIQLAPVLLRLHWGPFNPQAWLEFLLHPLSPLSRRLSRELAFALNNAPSRENPAWARAIEKAIDAAQEKEEKKRLKKQVKDWLSPHEFDGQADSKVLAATIIALSEWLGRRGALTESKEESDHWLAASLAMRKLARTIESVDTLVREDLERIVSEWLPSAAAGESTAAELGGARRLGSPAHLLEPVDHVVWWQPEEKADARLPWTKSELAWLAENDVIFPDRDLLSQTRGELARNLILNTRESLTIFYCPKTELGQSSAIRSPIMIRLQAMFGDDLVLLPDELIDWERVPVVPLPPPQTRWTLSNPALLGPRETESFSSLSRMIYIPWDWVFNYKAKLRKGALIDYRVVDDARRQGSLLHGFVESLLEPEPDPEEIKEDTLPHGGSSDGISLLDTLVRRLFSKNSDISWKKVSQQAVSDWVAANWNDILKRQAAHYLVPGNEASRSELLYLAKTALWELIQQLRAADVVSAICEEEIENVPFCGGKIGGFVDLRVINSKGDFGVIDLKLSGLTNRRDELAKGRHLQLAIYGHLIRSAYEQNAYCAYFIFSGGGKLLARSRKYFPNAEVANSSQGRKIGEWGACWEDFEHFWTRRRGELDQGEIHIAPSLELGTWEIREPGRYSIYQNLTGWNSTD